MYDEHLVSRKAFKAESAAFGDVLLEFNVH